MDLRSRLGLSQIIMYFSLIFLLSYTGLYASANNTDAEVVGNIYEFPKDSHYEFHESKKSVKSDICETYGTFKISGDISVVGTKNGVPSYEIEE